MKISTPGTSLFLAMALSALGACGSDINDAPPRLIPGGGIGDGAILGLVHVTVIDGDTDQPIGNAAVRLGEPGETPLEGLTDSAGLLTIEDGSLDGATTVTVTHEDYVASTWFGANGANITIPLTVRDQSPEAVPQAQLEGGINGWDTLPIPPQGHLILGVVTATQSGELGDPANEIPQSMMDQNVCVRLPFIGGDCDWTLDSRTGDLGLYALIIDLDTATEEIEIIGLAYKLGVTVEADVGQNGIMLDLVEAGALENLDVTLPMPPPGLDATALLGLDLGDAGLMITDFLDPEAPTVTVPSLVGDFASATYTGIAIAEGSGGAAAIVINDLPVSDGAVDFGEWLSLPSELAYAGGEYSFTPSADASLHIVDIADSNGDNVWAIALADGRTSFTLPGLDPDPLPSGELTFTVNALDIAIDLQDFSLDDLLQDIARTASNEHTFTR